MFDFFSSLLTFIYIFENHLIEICMKKKIWILLTLLVLFGLGKYAFTFFPDSGTVEASEVQYHNNLFMTEEGEPFSGTLCVRQNDLPHLAKNMFNGLGLSSFHLRYLPNNPKAFKQPIFKGIVLHVDVDEGILDGETKVFLDLREAGSKLVYKDLHHDFMYFLAKTFKNRIKIAEFNLKNNALEGESKIWLPRDGGGGFYLKASAHFENNLPNGIATVYYDNGEINREQEYKNGVISGNQKYYYRSGNIRQELIREGAFLKKKLAYYDNGQLRSETIYDPKTRRLRSVKTWYPDGSKYMVDEYLHDNTNQYEAYYSNGELQEKRINGKIEKYPPKGQIELFYNNGQLKSSYQYSDQGELNGPYEIYYSSGQMWEKGSYKNGKKDGRLQKWYTNGQEAEDHQMVNGGIDGPYERYYYNGILWKKGTFKIGKAVGLYEKWFNNGQLAYSYHYDNGMLHGSYKKWYPDGTLRMDCHYKNGKLDGDYKNWKKNGSLYKSCQYKNGKEIK
jgi:antitoxin component YwqK of YwqJK toxin-antitoxin module